MGVRNYIINVTIVLADWKVKKIEILKRKRSLRGYVVLLREK